MIECKDGIKTRDRFIPIEGSLAAVSMIRAKGYKLAVIFDQPGISRGELTIDEVEDMNNYMIELFGDVGCPSIDGVLYNMSDSKDDMYAKPKTAMLKRLRDEFRVPIKGGYYVGDRLVDAKMALNKIVLIWYGQSVLFHNGLILLPLKCKKSENK